MTLGSWWRQDLRGHALLLEAAARQGVSHFVYTSTAVVYGKPSRVPVDEGHPLNVLAARKLRTGSPRSSRRSWYCWPGQAGMSSTIVRFWWAFGDEIGGRHLREMLRTSAEGKPLAVPADWRGELPQSGRLQSGGGNNSPASGGGRQGLQPGQRLCDLGRRGANGHGGHRGTRRDRSDTARCLGRRRISPPTDGSWTTAGSGSRWASSRVERHPEFGTPCDRRSARRGGRLRARASVTRSVLRFGGRVLSRSVEASDMRFPDRHDGGTS